MSRFFFDLETNGLLESVTTIHSLVLQNADTGEMVSCADQPGYVPVREGLELLCGADEIIGHNIIGFDLRVVRKLHPWFAFKGRVTDTLVLARLWKSGDALREDDAKRIHRGEFPRRHLGSHALEAWGHRLGILKDEYDGGWEQWNPDMQAYCEQDVRVTAALHQRLAGLDLGARAVELEHRVAEIIARQEERGFAFDVAAAEALTQELLRERAVAAQELTQVFSPWYEPDGKDPVCVPKVSRAALGITKGVPYTKVRLVTFNPGSRAHLAKRLRALYGWTPEAYTPTGEPKIDDEVLSRLPWHEAKAAARYYMIEKRLGQLAEGSEAWLSHVRNGRIHGSVNPLGAHTGRMTHSAPNLAQVPSVRAPYGKQCRSLFVASPGYFLVGIDAEALELCCFAHFLARYDGGAYAEVVLHGEKEKGTDIHSTNARALGLDPKAQYCVGGQQQTGRDIAKVWFYAWLYGAGNKKLAEILGVQGSDSKRAAAGARSARKFSEALPAAGRLVEALSEALSRQGFIYGLDRRRLYPRHPRAALNTLLQSAGAVIMKVALVLFDERLQAAGLVPGRDYEFVANVHDEWQVECLPEHVETVKTLGPASITAAGEELRLRCPLRGSAAVGRNWAETH